MTDHLEPEYRRLREIVEKQTRPRRRRDPVAVVALVLDLLFIAAVVGATLWMLSIFVDVRRG